MKYRKLGSTEVKVSEIGFGAWAIGGKSYGAVDEKDALNALTRAEELGCNFVDTAAVYGSSEQVLGKFLKNRREKWVIASKYSGQKEGITATVDQQLRTLRTETIDIYQLHWVPREQQLYDELSKLKESGKIRFAGVSLYSENDFDFVLKQSVIDCLQIPFSLLEPYPLLLRYEDICQRKYGIIIRSALKSGFLSGKYNQHTTFTHPNDNRSKMSKKEIVKLSTQVDVIRSLSEGAQSVLNTAVAYVLSFEAVSSVILGTKTPSQAQVNFEELPGKTLGQKEMASIKLLQKHMGLLPGPIQYKFKKIVDRVIHKLK